jgi:hypothetical protein
VGALIACMYAAAPAGTAAWQRARELCEATPAAVESGLGLYSVESRKNTLFFSLFFYKHIEAFCIPYALCV